MVFQEINTENKFNGAYDYVFRMYALISTYFILIRRRGEVLRI